MKKKKATVSAMSVFSAVLTAGTICAVSVLPALPAFAAAAPNGGTAVDISQNETAGSPIDKYLPAVHEIMRTNTVTEYLYHPRLSGKDRRHQ